MNAPLIDPSEEAACDACWERIKGAVSCPMDTCIRDSTQDSMDLCWKDAHSGRLEGLANG